MTYFFGVASEALDALDGLARFVRSVYGNVRRARRRRHMAEVNGCFKGETGFSFFA